MAIKVGGTTVIDDSRELSNIASVDATTVAALGAAGIGGGPSFTASGSITAGDAVAISGEDIVSAVISSSNQTTSTGSHNSGSTTTMEYINVAYMGGDKFAVVYHQGSRAYLVIAQINGGSVSFGTRVEIVNATSYDPQVVYDSNSDKLAVTYSDYTNRYVKTATVSGTTATMTGQSYNLGTYWTYAGTDMAFDSYNNKIILTSFDPSYVKVIVGDISGSSITFGSSVVVYSTAGSTSNPRVACDGSGRFAVAFARSGGKATLAAGTISGNSVTSVTTSNSNFDVKSGDFIDITFSSRYNKFFIGYSNASYRNMVTAYFSGTYIYFGSSSYNWIYDNGRFVRVGVLDSSGAVVHASQNPQGNVYIAHSSYNLSDQYGQVSNQNYGASVSRGFGFSTDKNQVLAVWQTSSSVTLNGYIFEPSYQNINEWIGFASSSATHGNSVSVDVIGSINSNQTGLPSGADIYLQDNGDISSFDPAGSGGTEFHLVGRAVSPTKLLITTGKVTT
jgi:hypothetical protein